MSDNADAVRARRAAVTPKIQAEICAARCRGRAGGISPEAGMPAGHEELTRETPSGCRQAAWTAD
jgi:hypothetical protein